MPINVDAGGLNTLCLVAVLFMDYHVRRATVIKKIVKLCFRFISFENTQVVPVVINFKINVGLCFLFPIRGHRIKSNKIILIRERLEHKYIRNLYFNNKLNLRQTHQLYLVL